METYILDVDMELRCIINIKPSIDPTLNHFNTRGKGLKTVFLGHLFATSNGRKISYVIVSFGQFEMHPYAYICGEVINILKLNANYIHRPTLYVCLIRLCYVLFT